MEDFAGILGFIAGFAAIEIILRLLSGHSLIGDLLSQLLSLL